VDGVVEAGALIIIVLVLLCGAVVMEPFFALAFFPYADFNFAFLGGVGTLPIHLAQLPPAFIFSSVWPLKHAVALLVIVYVLTLILATVRPGESAIAVHLIMLPIPLKLSSILPGVGTAPVDIVFQEIAIVAVAVVPAEVAFSLLHAILVVASVG